MNPFHLLREIHQTLLGMVAQLNRLETQGANLMAGQAELEAAIKSLTDSVDAETTRVQAVIDGLKAHPAAEELQPQIDELTAIKARLDAVQAPASP